ncbi:MAG TPA: hypothetical protein GX522_06715 [Firmicutes bacterium]|nr:hypothetical protein [Bacillota bacterium]
MSILVVSNGHGEDALAAVLAKELKEHTDLEIIALPLVGEGKAYIDAGIKRIHTQENLPSGGFVYLGIKNLWQDISSGLFKQIREQEKVLRRLKGVKLAICVGDTYNLFLVSKNLKTEIVFVPTAKSNYINPHSFLDIMIMKKRALVALPRDEVTAIDLRKRKVKANYLGNLMMDAIYPKGIDFGLDKPIGVLPGSRQDALDNMLVILKIIEKTKVRDHYLVAITSGFDLDRFNEMHDWDRDSAEFACSVLKKGSKRVYLCQGLFGDIINQADIMIGLSGTANEQAAGLGKPVVTFVGPGSQFTPYFAKKQKKLLGDAVLFVEGDTEDVAKAVDHLSLQPRECRKRGEVGKERMGKPGAAKKMSELILDIINKEVIS